MKLSPDIISRVTRAATSAMGEVAKRSTNDMSAAAVQDAKPEIATAIEKAVAAENTGDHAIVEVKSAWLSKINWTSFIGWASSAIVAFLLPYVVSIGLPEQIVAMFTVQSVQTFLTWLFKTYLTGTVTASSMKS